MKKFWLFIIFIGLYSISFSSYAETDFERLIQSMESRVNSSPEALLYYEDKAIYISEQGHHSRTAVIDADKLKQLKALAEKNGTPVRGYREKYDTAVEMGCHRNCVPITEKPGIFKYCVPVKCSLSGADKSLMRFKYISYPKWFPNPEQAAQ